MTYKVLVGKPEGKRLLGRPKHRWKANINILLNNWGVRLRTKFDWLWFSGELLWTH